MFDDMKPALFALLSLLPLAAGAAAPPAPCGAVPSERQINWQRMEWYAFVHFGLNTYTNREWGYGNESPSLFNPTGFQASEIVATFKKAGMKGMIYTAKHHDGFCTWPTQSTTHNITQSPWKNGQGDVVQEFAQACQKEGLKFGVYISPWDRNCASYGTSGYRSVYYKQIEELLTQYGPIFEIWFDGANGGDGYYGGACEKRNIGSADDYYGYQDIVKMVRSMQPDCIVWGAANHGDAVWGGSEKGHVPYPCWSVTKPNTPKERWMPLEGDTPINRAGWFWHPGQQDKTKSPKELMQVYMTSVGRGANLILNLAPDRQGKLCPEDVDALLQFGESLRQMLSHDMALGAKAKASEVRGNDSRFAASKVVDGDIESYWCPDDGSTTGHIELRLKKPACFDVVRIREQIRLGQRVKRFQIDAWVNGQWKTVDREGETIGNQVLRQLAEPVVSNRLRVRITSARACPCISEISLLKMPRQLPAPTITKRGDSVHISLRAGCSTHYTTDGSMPDAKSPACPKDGVITAKEGSIVKAVHIDLADGECGPLASLPIGLSSTGWTSSTPGAKAAFDDDASTIWNAADAPASITVDLGKKTRIAAFSYLPRQDGQAEGMTDRYVFELSLDGNQWVKAAEGEFSNILANPITQTIKLKKTATARYFRFTGTRAVEGKGISVAEFELFPPSEAMKKSGAKQKKKQAN